jgi:hypothetical protein
MLLDRARWVNEIKTRLGYPVVNIEISDDVISQQCDIAIRKVAPYLNSVDVFTVGSSTVKFTDKLVYAVLRVHSPSGTYAQSNYQATTDIIQMNMYYGSLGNSTSFSNGLQQSLLAQTLYNNLEETVDDIGFRLAGDTLYIDGQKPPYTVEAITEKSVENMPENYVNWCFEYSLALTKLILGRIYSKVTIQGSPVTLSSSDLLSEGNSAINELEQKLGTVSHSLFYCMR